MKGINFLQAIKNKIHLLNAMFVNFKYNYPAKSLKIIGVTGTDGKTTTATMIYTILKEAGIRVGLISSVSAIINNKEFDTGFHVTTPSPEELFSFLRKMVDNGIEWVVLEVTSHALDQNRVYGIEFESVVFTNITNEHLDYHKTWINYAKAKAKILSMVKEGGIVVYNADETGGKFIERSLKKSKKIFLIRPVKKEDYKVLVSDPGEIKFITQIGQESKKISLKLIGKYNIRNAINAIKVTEKIVPSEKIVSALSNFKGVKGRMNIVKKTNPCLTIVDFAHTPNALKRALLSLRKIKTQLGGKLIVVFGCAGLRDRKKRPEMGKIASKLADVIILTAEDPRTESLFKINNQIFSGMESDKVILVKRFKDHKSFLASSLLKIKNAIEKADALGKKVVIIFDEEKVTSRFDAISLAVKIAKKNDIIVATGKGHEKSLCFKKTEFEYSDFEAIKKATAK